MRQRGRNSVASLAIVSACEVPRPAPPRSMSREAKAIWRQTTARFQPEHFAGAQPVLEAYCECAALLRDLLDRIKQTKAAEPVNFQRLAVLMSLQRTQGLLIARLASALRISPRSRFDRSSAAARPLSGLPKPWELGGGSSQDDNGPDRGGSPFGGAA
jgi:hypothetical protein